MKALPIPRVGVLVAALAGCLVLIGCDGLLSDGIRTSPAGRYVVGDLTVNIGSGHTFRQEKLASAGDTRHYIINGTCTWTLVAHVADEEAYGHFDLTITSITVNGAPVDNIHPVNQLGHSIAATLHVGDACPGWWRYGYYPPSDANRFSLELNLPPNLRPGDPGDTGDWEVFYAVPG